MLVRNLPDPFKKALKSGAILEVLICDPESDLIREMEELELGDGRQGRSIKDCIVNTPGEFKSLIGEAKTEMASRDHYRIGSVAIGYMNTQYRESMIICDDDWGLVDTPFQPGSRSGTPDLCV